VTTERDPRLNAAVAEIERARTLDGVDRATTRVLSRESWGQDDIDVIVASHDTRLRELRQA